MFQFQCLLGDNGILTKARTAKEESNAGDIEEQNKLGKYNEMMDNYITSRGSSTIQENYSLDEKEIGTWVDGKVIYQKTVVTGPISSGYTNIAHNIQNIDKIINVNGIAEMTNNVFFPVPFSDSENGLIYVSADKTNLTFWTGTARPPQFVKIYMTLKYTKTT